MSNRHEYAVAVCIEAPEGIPLVRDPKKPMPVFWKFPGGKSEDKETALTAIIRETKEELGLTLSQDQLSVVVEENRGNHFFVLFKTTLPSLAGIKTTGNEGEEVKVFKKTELPSVSLFPPHKNLLRKLL